VTDRFEAEAAGGVSGRLDASSALSRCVVDPVHFAAERWGARPLLTRGSQLPGGFTDLLDGRAVDELVSRRGLRAPFLRMARAGTVIAAASFTRGGGAGATTSDQVADDLVLGQLADGATLVLQGLHRTWPPLITFGSRLAAELGHPVQVNAYITPPQNQGFAAHYDVHDVFVLQVAGRKQWHIHEPVLVNPVPSQPWEQRKPAVAARAAEPPIIDTVLESGDALYLPRGFVHSATALGQTSIHLTVGIHPRTRHDLIGYLARAARDDAALRSSLPVGSDLGDPEVLGPQLRATVDALHQFLDTVPTEQVASWLTDELMNATRPEPLAPLAQLASASTLDQTTSVRLRPGLRWRITRDDHTVALLLVGKTVTLPVDCDPALKAVLSGEVLTPAQLSGLDADEQVVLVRRLLREGVLVPA
jgi:lysine-specific demethylase/histidyl-hydroxylase NO66